MSDSLMPVFWVVLTFPVMLLLQRWIHRHLRGVALLITGRMDRAVILYAIILLPGVLLHELSHWATARLLGVRTGSLSLLPEMKKDGSVQLGYLEYYKHRNLGPIRESLIGGAPLISGTLVILLIGQRVFGVTDLAAAVQSADVEQLTQALGQIFSAADFFVWLYLIFVISNAMMPSPSDRRAWPAFAVVLTIVLALVYLLNLQQTVTNGLVGPVAVVLGYLGLTFSLVIGVDLIFIFVITLLEKGISRIRGVELVYEGVDALPS